MKPLLTIIILLSCLSGWGQKDTIRYEMMIDNDVIYLVPTKDDALISFGGLIDYWQSYKDECYADSTATKKYKWAVHDFGTVVDTVWHFWSINKPDKNTIYSNSWIVGDSIFYMHNNKPTFDGFMDYMERKYKPTKQ